MTDRKLKKQQDQNNVRIERQKQLMQLYKDKMMPLVKFLKKEGLPFKYARFGQNRIEYFRQDEYIKVLEQSKAKIQGNERIKNLLSEVESQHSLIFYKRPNESKNLKYPHVLQYSSPADPNSKFCSFKFDTTLSRKGLMIGLIIGVLALVLFPVWPFSVKYIIWLVSLYLLIFLVGLLAIRLIIYVICVVAGFNVWILPNLLGDYGFIDSFKPFVYAQRWERSAFNISLRLGAFLVLTYYGVQLYLDPTFLQSHFSVTKSTIEDIHDWGVSKIKNEVQFSQRAITNLEDILNQTADVEDYNQTNSTVEGVFQQKQELNQNKGKGKGKQFQQQERKRIRGQSNDRQNRQEQL